MNASRLASPCWQHVFATTLLLLGFSENCASHRSGAERAIHDPDGIEVATPSAAQAVSHIAGQQSLSFLSPLSMDSCEDSFGLEADLPCWLFVISGNSLTTSAPFFADVKAQLLRALSELRIICHPYFASLGPSGLELFEQAELFELYASPFPDSGDDSEIQGQLQVAESLFLKNGCNGFSRPGPLLLFFAEQVHPDMPSKLQTIETPICVVSPEPRSSTWPPTANWFQLKWNRDDKREKRRAELDAMLKVLQ